MVNLEFYDPSGRLEITHGHARRLGSLAGKRIGILSGDQIGCGTAACQI